MVRFSSPILLIFSLPFVTIQNLSFIEICLHYNFSFEQIMNFCLSYIYNLHRVKIFQLAAFLQMFAFWPY